MKVVDLIQKIELFIDIPFVDFKIEKRIFLNDNGRKLYNETIRDKVQKRNWVYIWVNSDLNEVVYIGMAGKIKSDGNTSKHSLQNRLLAPRGRDKVTKKDIQTNDFVSNYMISNRIESLIFYILYTKENEPPAFVESVLLYEFHKENNRLPQLNKSF